MSTSIAVLLALCLAVGADDVPGTRPTRTLSRIFGLEPSPPPVPQQQKPVLPLIYSVKYYDRTGEAPKDNAQGPQQEQQQTVGVSPSRVLLNLYTGHQTPVYYDNKGQVLVPCPAYEHLYISSEGGPVRKAVQRPQVVQQQQQQQQQPVPVQPFQVQPAQTGPVPLEVYYAAPAPIHQKPVVGYEYPYVYGYPAFGPSAYNPYVYFKPPVHGEGQVAPPVQPAQKKETEEKGN